MAGFVLDLGQQHCLALQRGRAGDPVAFRQLADDFRVRVLRDLADQGLAVGLGHPVLGLDLDAVIHAGLERALLRVHLFHRAEPCCSCLHQLCVHACSAFCRVPLGVLICVNCVSCNAW
ncbi:hypothetical protein D3C81_1863530 [compost metagenome]